MSDSVKKAFRIIRELAVSQEPQGLAALSRSLDMDKATALRYLQTLDGLGVVEKTSQGYRLGLALFELGNRVAVKRVLVKHIEPYMRELSRSLNETVNLAQLFHDQVIYLHKIESRHNLQMRADIGGGLPLHCAALGKVIMASVGRERMHAMVSAARLDAHTPHTITTRKQLLDEIAAVRQRGYGTDREELEIGLVCVAVPLVLERHDFIGGLSISAPSIRLVPERIGAFADKLLHVRDAIVASLQISPD
jgi:IclR family transcriptional regulator, KDG regulon repressor